MKKIEKYINEIRVFGQEYSFYGDGAGDFEKIGTDTTLECVLDYINVCTEQIRLASEYIDVKYGKIEPKMYE